MLQIQSVTLHDIEMPLVHPFETSFGRTTVRTALLVQVDGNGLTGWGELTAHDAPTFSYETIETSRHILEEFLIPKLLSLDFEHPSEFLQAVAFVRGHPMAKASLEAALYDMAAQAAGLPLSKFLGGVRDSVAVGVSLGIEPTIEALLERIEMFRAAGYRRIKLKIKPGWDLKVLEAVRHKYPGLPLTVDANCAYRAIDFPRLLELDRFDLVYVEQPLPYDDLVDHARLQAELKTDLCLDESIANPAACRTALALRSGRVVNIKMGRVGGHTEARRIHDLCQGAGWPVWCGGMLETGIGRAHNVAMATLPNFLLPGDISASDRYYAEDLVDPPFRLEEDGTLAVPDGPGIGVEVRRDVLSQVTREQETFQR
jgi:O-succinylbenzoate synthase